MKTPRNSPCPCGSGQKHKECCGSSKAFNAEQKRKAEDEEKRRKERKFVPLSSRSAYMLLMAAALTRRP